MQGICQADIEFAPVDETGERIVSFLIGQCKLESAFLGVFFFSSRRRHTSWNCDWSSDVCSSDLLGDHIEELRRHMIKALFGFAIAMIGGFIVSPYVLDWIKEPVETGLDHLHEQRLLKIISDQDALDAKVKELINVRRKNQGLEPTDAPPEAKIYVSQFALRKILGMPTDDASTEQQEMQIGIRASDLYIITQGTGEK